MAYVCASCGGAVMLERTPLESGLVRLAVWGADGFELRFDEAELHAAAAPLLGSCPHDADPSWDAEALRPVAAVGWDRLQAAAADDDAMARLAALWRPRALALAGRGSEVAGDDIVRARLGERLADIAERLEAARAAGDDDEAQRLHARYIELGTTYAGRTAAAVWRG